MIVFEELPLQLNEVIAFILVANCNAVNIHRSNGALHKQCKELSHIPYPTFSFYLTQPLYRSLVNYPETVSIRMHLSVPGEKCAIKQFNK